MAENHRLETVFLWGLTVALAVIAVLHWAAYVIGPATWRTSWPAIPLTGAAIAAGLGALAMQRRGDRVRLLRED